MVDIADGDSALLDRLLGLEHHLMLCLPEAPPRTAGPGRHIRLYLSREPGPDFS